MASLSKLPLSRGESRVDLYSSDDVLRFSESYESEDGEHGFSVEKAEWTPDSQFFIYSLSSSGGHQAWHFPVDFIAAKTQKIYHLDELQVLATDPEFSILPPDIVTVSGRDKTTLNEMNLKKALSDLINTAKP